MKITEHAYERAKERGTNEDEIKFVLLKGIEVSAKKGRKAKEYIFEYEKLW